MERGEREGSSGRRVLKQETKELSSCSYSKFAKDKENSEPMDVGSPMMLTEPSDEAIISPPYQIATQNSGSTKANTLGGAQDTPLVSEVPQIHFSPQRNGSSRSSMVHIPTGATPDVMRNMIGTPQSLSQIINLPSSAFSFDLCEMQSPIGSGFLSPLGSAKLGKKRPLSISPLSTSSVNIDALVRGSPTSLINFIAQSRSSSAGSFGHLSPSLYTSPAVHNTFNRPAISLSKAVHPPLFHNAQQSNTVNEEKINGFYNEEGYDKCKHEDKKELTIISELADLADRPASIQPLSSMGASLEQEPSDEFSLLTQNSDYSSTFTESTSESENKSSQRNRRIYYAYPAVEQPHHNRCMWENCQQQCESLDHLVCHVNTDHIYQDSRKEFICRWSGCVRDSRPFKAQYMLLVHMRRHTGEKPHKCHYEGCEKAYSRLENLKTHLRSHTGEKPYLCKYEGCGKAFSNASDCAKHMNRTHSDEKPYACLNPGCTKRYTDPSSRRKHMKNCQINKKVRTCVDDSTEDSSMDIPKTASSTTSANKSPQTNKKTGKPRKTDKKKKADESKPSQTQFTNIDMGYMSGESQCAPGMLAMMMSGRTQLSGYNSSGYDTEYPSLPEDHNIPPLISVLSDQSDQFYSQEDIKTEQFSPSSQLGEQAMSYQLSQPPPPYSNGGGPHARTLFYTSPNLQTLPEITAFDPNHHNMYSYSHPNHSYHPNLIESHSSGYSSFGNSPIRIPTASGGGNDDTASLVSSFNGSGHHSSSSHSIFSSHSSRLSSPSSNHGREYSKISPHSYRNLRPPELIMRTHHQPYSVMMSDIKSNPPYYRRHSDEVSLRSSHSSRYSVSGSEYSDDLQRSHSMVPPPLPPPDLQPSPRQPLPLPQSMQSEFANIQQPDMVPMTTDSQNHFISNDTSSATYLNVGSIPLQHFEPQIKTPLPMIVETQVRADSPNMVMGNMAINSSQLHQDSLLLESLTSNAVVPSAILVPTTGLPH